MADRSVPGLRLPVRLRAIVAAACLGLVGCRPAPIAFHAFPEPALSADLATAERRAREELSPREFTAFLAAHDAYLAAWGRVVRDQAEPLARQVREAGEESLRNDLGRLRSLGARQKGVLARFAALDADLAGSIAGLGPSGPAIARRFTALRSLDRTNAVLKADGGEVLRDLRDLVEAARGDLEIEGGPGLDPARADELARALDRHDELAGPLRDAAALAVGELAIDARALEERSPPAETLVDPALDEKARRDAINRISFERTAAARERLARAITRLSDLDDTTAGEIAALWPELGAALERRLLRDRVRDPALGGEITKLSFRALVAARARELDAPVRETILRERREFLDRDADRVREAFGVIRAGFVPGVFEPGGRGAGGKRTDRLREIEGRRRAELDRFQRRLAELIGPDLARRLDELPSVPREELPAGIAEIAGEGQAARLLAAMPRDFSEVPAAVEPVPGGSREERIFLPAPIGAGEVDGFADRCGIRDAEPTAWVAILAAYRERRDEEGRASRERFAETLKAAVESVVSPTGADRTSRAIAKVFALADEIRATRLAEDEALIADLAAAAGRELPAGELAFWRRERIEAARRIRWLEIPGGNLFRISREATVDVATLAGRLDLTGAERGVIAATLEEFGIDSAAEALRREWANALRRAFTAAIDAQASGRNFEPEDRPEDAAELDRMRRPAVAAGDEVVRIHRAFLGRMATSLPRGQARALREAYVEAAYPGALAEEDSFAEALEPLRDDSTIPAEPYAAILVLLEARDEARDAALGDLLAWKDAVAGDSIDREISRDDLRRDHPLFTLALALRREADLRCARQAWALLDDDARSRHRRLGEVGRRAPPRPESIRSFE